MAYAHRAHWSVNSLALQVLGDINETRDPAGNAPDTLINLVAETMRNIWEDREWWWQRQTETLSVSADDTEEAMPADFRKLDSKWINDAERTTTTAETHLGLVFTEDLSLFQMVKDSYGPSDTGEPVIACIMQDTSETDYVKWKAVLAPKSDDNYVYTFVYIPACPIDLDSDATLFKNEQQQILMPNKFHEGWRIRATLRAAKAGTDLKKDMRRDWKEWQITALREHNEQMTDAPRLIRDSYGDRSAIPGVGAGSATALRRMRGTVLG